MTSLRVARSARKDPARGFTDLSKADWAYDSCLMTTVNFVYKFSFIGVDNFYHAAIMSGNNQYAPVGRKLYKLVIVLFLSHKQEFVFLDWTIILYVKDSSVALFIMLGKWKYYLNSLFISIEINLSTSFYLGRYVVVNYDCTEIVNEIKRDHPVLLNNEDPILHDS